MTVVGAAPARRRVAAAVLASLAALWSVPACGGDQEERVDVGVELTGGVQAQAEGRLEEAEQHFEQVVTAEPGNRVALYNLGILRRADGDLEAALEAFTQLIDADPAFSAARHQRAITLQSAGDLDGAIADLRIVVSQDPANVDARTQLGMLLIATGERDEGEALLEP